MTQRSKLLRSLTVRIALSYVFLTLALNVVLVVVLSTAATGGLEQSVDIILEDVLHNSFAHDPPSRAEIQAEQEVLQEEGIGKAFYMRLIDPTGKVLLSSGMKDTSSLERVRALRDQVENGQVRKDTIKLATGPDLRVWTRRFSDGTSMQVGAPLIPNPALQKNVLQLGLLGVFGLTILAASIGWFMARGAMRGVRSVTSTAQGIFEETLDARVPVDQGVYEISELAGAFNAMLDRIERLVGDVQRVSADMAHDLRSPLTRMRVQAECVLRGPQDLETYQEVASKVVEEVVVLDRLIDTTLQVIALDAGVRPTHLERSDLALLTQAVLDLYTDLAADRGIDLSAELGDAVFILVDPPIMSRVIANLMDNAIKYTPEGGALRVVLQQRGNHAELTVSDSGPGIPIDERVRVFERFYRADVSRGTPGSGLGLSYVQAAMQVMSGTVEIRDASEGGAELSLRLPVASEQAPG